MNIDDSGESSSCAVRSKYFSRNPAMDESLSEFQETKKSYTGPKNVEKKNSKPRKAPKRPRGQKDIRTVLRAKKNELESYSEDFDKVCKKAGIDVNSEQLQLAIALSKSLQDTKTTANESSEGSKTLTTQDRIGKIRTTLQEYGFKVPEIKIAVNTRKIRKHRKNHKLIQTSDIEKKEIIANRFSQILFQNITHCSLYCSDIDITNISLFNLASNVPYDVLKIKDTFYVNNFIEKSVSTGNLLRDWSTIPGRPKSPKLFEPMSVNFSEIECSQDELDIILSGSLKSCREIARKKIKDCLNSNECKIISKEDNISIENTNKEETNKNSQGYTIAVNDVEVVVEPISILNKYRSNSPDMFDEEISDIFDDIRTVTMQKEKNPELHKTNTNLEVMDLTEPVCEKSQHALTNSNVTIRKSNDMELTECIEIPSKYQCEIINQTTSQLSQKTNVTKRRSNDFMELTECVTTSSSTSSQPMQMQHNIDLTQSPDIIEENTLNYETNKDKTINAQPSESIDIVLTSSTENNNDDVENRNTPKEVDLDKDAENMNLTQSSNTSDELPFVSLTAAKEYSLDDTIILDIDDYAYINKGKNSQTEKVAHIDLTQNMQSENLANKQSQSFFEEYNHNHSDSTENTEENNSSIIANEENHEKIDLTQCPDTKSYKNKNRSREPSGNLEGNNSNSLSQPKYGKNSSQSIIEPVPVIFYPENFQCKVNLTLNPNGQSDHNAIDEIDLTQKTDSSEESDQPSKNDRNDSMIASNEDCTKENYPQPVTISQRCSSLGKKDDVSIDYDELINTDANNELLCSKNANPESIIYENSNENIEKFTKSNSFISNCSQNSEAFEISDKELDYSLHKSKLEIPRDNFAFGGISIMDDLSNLGATKKSIESENNSIVNDEIEIESLVANNNKKNPDKSNEISPIKHRRIIEIATPQKACSSNTVIVFTPKNSEMIIKTNNVTPMMDYECMSLSEIHEELDKYGIKPFKRKRAIQLLTHIYKETHPIMDPADDLASPPKRRKPNDPPTSSKNHISPRKLLTSLRKTLNDTENINKNIPDIDKENNLRQKSKKVNGYTGKGKGKGKSSLKNQNKDVPEKLDGGSIENTQNRNKEIANEVPVCIEIKCSPDDWVFQKREKAKVHSCRVPLHIAFYNYVSSRRDLREAILCYEPVEIDLIHKDLVSYGHRYDPKDLLKFLDKKCITVKTTDNDAKNHRNN